MAPSPVFRHFVVGDDRYARQVRLLLEQIRSLFVREHHDLVQGIEKIGRKPIVCSLKELEYRLAPFALVGGQPVPVKFDCRLIRHNQSL